MGSFNYFSYFDINESGQNRLAWLEILEMLWSVIRLIFKTSSVTPDFIYVFNLILSFSTCSQSFKKICTWELLDAKISKKSEKLFPQKSLVQKSRESKCIFHGSRKNRKPVSRGRKYIDSRITEKINPHSRFTQSKNAHSRVTKKSIGDPPANHNREDAGDGAYGLSVVLIREDLNV